MKVKFSYETSEGEIRDVKEIEGVDHVNKMVDEMKSLLLDMDKFYAGDRIIMEVMKI